MSPNVRFYLLVVQLKLGHVGQSAAPKPDTKPNRGVCPSAPVSRPVSRPVWPASALSQAPLKSQFDSGVALGGSDRGGPHSCIQPRSGQPVPLAHFHLPCPFHVSSMSTEHSMCIPRADREKVAWQLCSSLHKRLPSGGVRPCLCPVLGCTMLYYAVLCWSGLVWSGPVCKCAPRPSSASVNGQR